MINANWSKWIQRAILKHFKTNLSGYTVFLETEDVDKNSLRTWIEVRLDITYHHLQGNKYRVTIPVDILVMSAKAGNIYDAKSITGLVASAFSSIQVYDDSEPTRLPVFCLRPKGQIVDNYYGETELQANMEQATVEGIYEAHILE